MTALELRASGELAIPRRLVDAVRTLLFLLVSLVVGIGDLVFLPIAAIAGPAAVRRMLESERALVNQLLCARVPAPPPLEPDTTVTQQQLAFLAGKLPISLGAAIVCAIPTALFVELVAHSIQGLTASSSAYLGPWPLGPVVGLVLLLLAIPALMLSVGALEATAALISQVSRRGLSSPGRHRRARARGARRAPRRSNAGDRVLAPRAAAVRRRARPSGHASRAGHVQGMDGCGAPRQSGCRDHPRCGAAGPPRVRGGGGGRSSAGARQRAAQGRPQRPAPGPARLPSADRRGDRRGPSPARARSTRWGPAAPRLDVSRSPAPAWPTGGRAGVELLDSAIATLGEAQIELRELARGIHPPMLSDRGLGPALDSLAQRSAVPVELELRLADDGFPRKSRPPVTSSPPRH